MDNKKILIIEDDINIASLERDYLEANGYCIQTEFNGEKGLKSALNNDYSCVIVDIMLPGMDGFEICRRIRKEKDVPIIIVTAKKEDIDKIRGLGIGADDYIVKPFPLSVLHQKCLSMITMSKGTTKRDEISLNGIVIDLAQRKVFVENTEITLTTKDYELLRYLMENKNIVLDREKILNRIWGWEYEGTSRVVDTHIKRIRKALGEKAGCIRTVVNVGYTFEC